MRARNAITLTAWGWSLLVGLALLASTFGTAGGKVPFSDFSVMQIASRLASHGEIAKAYDGAVMMDLERAAQPTITRLIHFTYPPTYLLLLRPLDGLPDGIARLLWTGFGLAAFGAALAMAAGAGDRPAPKSAQSRMPIWALVLLCYPVASNLAGGQNGTLFAGILGVGLLMIPSRPWLAGCVLAWLSLKPQYGLLVPFALIGLRAWQPAIAAGLVSLVLVATSLAVYGPEGWTAFVGGLSGSAERLAGGGFTTMRMVTPFAAIYDSLAPWSGSRGAAGIGQIAVSGLLASAVYACARKRSATDVAWIVLAATPAATPYAFDYDLAVTGIAVIGLGRAAVRERSGTVEALFAVTLAAATWGLGVFVLTGERMNGAIASHPATLALLGFVASVLWTTARGTTLEARSGGALTILVDPSCGAPDNA